MIMKQHRIAVSCGEGFASGFLAGHLNIQIKLSLFVFHIWIYMNISMNLIWQ